MPLHPAFHPESSLALIGAMRDCGAPAFQISMARELLACGADPDVRDARGLTPLMWAAREGREQAAALFAGLCDHSLRSQDGRSPLHLACAGGHEELALSLCGPLGAYDPRERDASGASPIDAARAAGHGKLADTLAEMPRRPIPPR